uniref:Uncharacterized protein n=1 Tax=Populus trichocarpa TaxID=3694 RepID=B9INX1_POPTR
MKTTRVVLRTKPSQPYHYQFNNHQASITMHRPGLKWNQGKQSWDTAESYCAGYIVAAKHEDENIYSSVVLAAESAPAEYPCQVSEQVLLKPLGLSEEAFDKQRNQ